MIEVIILSGIYKGYKGIVLNSNSLNKTYNVSLEANGAIVNISHSLCQEISNITDEELYIFNNPSNIVHNNDSIYFISNTEPENLSIDQINDSIDPETLEQHENLEIDNDEYKDNNEDKNDDKLKRKRSSSDSKKYIQGYNENYTINSQFNYNKDDKQIVPIIKQYLEEICSIVGIDILENQNVFYYSHLNKVLELINGTTQKIISEKQIDLLKSKKIKYDATSFTTNGFKQYTEINDKNLKAITAGYMLFYINNVGLTNLHNFQAISFLKQHNEKITFTNYYYSSLYTRNFFGKKVSFDNITTIVNKIKSFIASSNIDYILFPDNEITNQNLNDNIINHKHTHKENILIRPVKFTKFKVIPEDRTKRIKTLPINDPGLNKLILESYYENIFIFKQFIKNTYYDYNKKIDITEYFKKPSNFKINDELKNTLKFLAKNLNSSNKEMLDSYLELNSDKLDNIYDKKFIESFDKFNVLFKKEYNISYSKKLLVYSGLGFKKQKTKTNFEQFTFDKIKTIIMNRFESSNTPSDLLHYITKNIDNILNGDITGKTSKELQVIKDIQHFYIVQYYLLTKGTISDTKKQKEAQELYKSHYNDYMSYEHKKMQILKIQQEDTKLVKNLTTLKINSNFQKGKKDINKEMHDLIQNEPPTSDISRMKKKAFEQGLLSFNPFSKYNSTILSSKKNSSYKPPLRITSDISNSDNFKIDNNTQKLIQELSNLIEKNKK